MIQANVHLGRGGFSLDVDLDIDSHITGLFGPSGAGKSTLINLIAGLDRPDHGRIELDAETLFDGTLSIDVPPHRRGVGVVFQEHRLFPHLSVKANLLYGRPRDERQRTNEFRQVIDLLELGGLLRRRISQISGGERQRVALGRALVSQPRLLLLDEPLASLDQRLKQQIIPYLQRVRDVYATPMLYVSHDLTEILQLTDRLIVLEQGRVVGQGRYVDLVHDAAVIEVVHDRGMRNVLTASVVQHKPTDGVSVLQLGNTNDPSRRLIIPLCAGPPGIDVTITIYPWDIALASEPVHNVSIQNQIRGTVTRCTLLERSAMVEVDVGAPLIVEVSRRSAQALNLAEGRPIMCLIKSNAIRHIANH